MESSESSRSAFSWATLPPELTMSGGLPSATWRPSAVALAPEFMFVICSALALTGAVSVVFVVAEFGTPRMKLPPVAAMPTPPIERNRATSDTVMGADGRCGRRRCRMSPPQRIAVKGG